MYSWLCKSKLYNLHNKLNNNNVLPSSSNTTNIPFWLIAFVNMLHWILQLWPWRIACQSSVIRPSVHAVVRSQFEHVGLHNDKAKIILLMILDHIWHVEKWKLLELVTHLKVWYLHRDNLLMHDISIGRYQENLEVSKGICGEIFIYNFYLRRRSLTLDVTSKMRDFLQS